MYESSVEFPRLKVGDRVQRGPDWMWGYQDCNEKGERQTGKVVSIDPMGGSFWARVEWADGTRNGYRYYIGARDIRKVGNSRSSSDLDREAVFPLMKVPDGTIGVINSPVSSGFVTYLFDMFHGKEPSPISRAKSFLNSL